MVRSNPSRASQKRQLAGKESPTSEDSKRAVKHFIKTGRSKPLERVAKNIAARIASGGGAQTQAELAATFAASEPAIRPVYTYACAECGTMVNWPKRQGTGPAPRCNPCRRQARLKTKRDTWHKNKEKYRAGIATRKQDSQSLNGEGPAPVERLAPLEELPVDRSTPTDPRVVWSPPCGD